MRRHAKASSAGTSMRQARGLGRIIRGALAARGDSRDADGSGAPSQRGRLALLLAVLTALAGLMGLSPVLASARSIHPFLETFGSANQPSFNSPRGIAIYQATGDVYVMDAGFPRSIKRYHPDGSADDFSALGTNAIDGKEGADATPQNGLGFASPSESQIAVDNSGGPTDGDIYVTQSSPNVINIFSATGAYLGQLSAAGTTSFSEACGVAVDPSGAVYVGDFGSGIYKFVPSANPPVNADNTAHFTTTSSPCTLAAGSGATAGFLFPAQYNGAISKIDSSTGELKYSFSENVTTVSVDPATGDVYALKGSEFKEFDASGAASATQLSSDALAAGGRGIAVRGSTGNVYVSREGASNLEVFGPLTIAPDVTAQAATGITATEATLNGTVNPDGVEITECKFEYGLTTEAGYANSVPCEQAVPTDSSDHAVSAEISGLGAGGTEYRFRLVAKNAGATEASAPETFHIVTPTVTAQAATGITATEATLNGTVNPNGIEITECKFEYGLTTEAGYANSVPCEQAVPTDSSDHAVSADVSGLSAGGTQYRFRLVAKNAGSTEASAPETFRVGATINGTAASVGSEEATLRGSIVPGGQAASYEFEWGATSAYGNTTTPGNIAAGEEPVVVEEELTGLAPGQTYHYRLLATDGAGTTQGPDQTFTTSTGPPQLPQRGYEIASQYPTGGVPINEFAGAQTASEDGNGVAVGTESPLAHSTLAPMPDDPLSDQAGGLLQNIFTRGSDSWQRTEVGLGGYSWSGDLQRLVTTTETQAPGSNYTYEDARVAPDDQNESLDVYEWQPDGKLIWISRDPRIPVGTPQTVKGEYGQREADLASNVGSFGMSADGHTVLFKSKRQLLDADTTPTASFSQPFRLYKWEDGQLSFIGVRPDGSVPSEGSELGDYGYLTSDRYAVSRDGTRVIFSAHRRDGVGSPSGSASASTGAGLYIQSDGQPTVEATKEEGVPPLPAPQPYAVTYRGAAADDSRVFFTSASRFTPDSGGSYTDTFNHQDDLYAYDVATNKLRDLTPRLDGLEDPSVDPPLADRARVLGVAANSEDGKRIYFVAEGALPTAPNPEGELPQASSPNLYMAELDSIDGPEKLRFVATLGSGDEGDWQASWKQPNGPNNVNTGKTALASADGTVLGFGSLESLTGQPLGGTEQLFVFDAKSGTLDCASCPSNGTLPADSVNKRLVLSGIGGDQIEADWQAEGGVRRWMSSDGAVFFTTPTPLLSADENTVADVYEFREGELRLISTGKGTANSLLSDASVDGSTVFFNTQEALAPQDKEPGVKKIYAARVGGGFPYTPPPAPCDFNAGACEGAPSTAPETPGAGTAAFEGPGNPKPRHHRKKRHRRRRHHARHHHRTAKHNRRASR